jgi:hypothetical protein
MPDKPNAQIVTDFLKANKSRYFCHSCVSAGTGVTPQAQVNQIIRPLEHAKEYRYMQTTCSECSHDRKCVGYFG